MNARMQRWLERLHYSFWFVPTLMALGALVLSVVAVQVDQAMTERWSERIGWLYESGPDGAREVLAVIAGSMITVAGVVFSITIVALSLASQQLGPRLLRTFMRDTGNQVVLGTFIATFLYCLLVLRTIYVEAEEAFVPQLSVAFGVFLGVASLGVLIYFIHHVAISIQAPNVIAAVGRDLLRTIDETFPEAPTGGESERVPVPMPEGLPEGFDTSGVQVHARATGYIQAVDEDTLLRVAARHDLLLRVVTRPGNFVIQGQTLVKAWPADRATERDAKALREAFVIGRRRTSTQDVEFAVDQLVEVGVRALSASINDPFTAMSCVDWLSAGLYRLAQRHPPSAHTADRNGRLRVVMEVSTFEGIADDAFNQLRQHGRGDVAVTCRLLEAIWRVSTASEAEGWRRILLRHARLIYRGSLDLPEALDRRDVAERYRAIVERIGLPAEDVAGEDD
jgi:uncharacterized membrane protein